MIVGLLEVRVIIMHILLMNFVYILSLVILMDLFEEVVYVKPKSTLIGENICQ